MYKDNDVVDYGTFIPKKTKTTKVVNMNDIVASIVHNNDHGKNKILIYKHIQTY